MERKEKVKYGIEGILVKDFDAVKQLFLNIKINDIAIINYEEDLFLVPNLYMLLKKMVFKKVSVDKIKKSFSMVGLKIDDLNTDPLFLTKSDKFKLLIACALLNNNETIAMIFPDFYLDDFSLSKIFKLFNKMDNNLHKRIVIVSNDVNLIFKECSNLLIYNDGKIILNVNNKDLFDNREILLNNGFVLPDILKFIEVALDKKNIKLVPTNDIKELMKDVYRNV